jgi:hypothetical protein
MLPIFVNNKINKMKIKNEKTKQLTLATFTNMHLMHQMLKI